MAATFYDKCSFHSVFFSLSFSFFISCSAPETQILAHCSPSVLRIPFPPTYVATLTCQPHTYSTHSLYAKSHTDTVNITPYHTVLTTYKNMKIYRSCKHAWHHKNWDIKLLQYSETEKCWLSCPQIAKGEKKKNLCFLSSAIVNPPSPWALYLRGCFSGLLHPGTLRALCDSVDREVTVTEVSKHTQCRRNSVCYNPWYFIAGTSNSAVTRTVLVFVFFSCCTAGLMTQQICGSTVSV